MTIFQIIALLSVAVAAGGYLNHKILRLPESIGQMTFALLLSVAMIAAGKLGLLDVAAVRNIVSQLDFPEILLHGMLSVLLFAGALHIPLQRLKAVALPVLILATIGVMISTFVTGLLTWYAGHLIGLDFPMIYALLFGALISPTDPIAVLSILKKAGLSETLYVKVGGESLFNDGVGVVVFITMLGLATGSVENTASYVLEAFLKEGVGGLIFGVAAGWLVYRVLRTVHDYKLEVLLTLALVFGGYAAAEYIHVSAPIAMVAAGLIVGNLGRNQAMSDESRVRLDDFWDLLDEIFNAILFLLIGLEILIIPISTEALMLGLIAIPVVLFARFVSVGVPISILRLRTSFDRGTIRLLTWGGLRGGISIALALSLPDGNEKDIILPVAYIVVLFSIFAQGLTFGRVIDTIYKKDGLASGR